jgi:hypothetical protein
MNKFFKSQMKISGQFVAMTSVSLLSLLVVDCVLNSNASLFAKMFVFALSF